MRKEINYLFQSLKNRNNKINKREIEWVLTNSISFRMCMAMIFLLQRVIIGIKILHQILEDDRILN